MSEMVARVEAAMTTYVEGSSSGGGYPAIWMIYKGEECVFSCPDRLERDAQLRKMNARAVIEAMGEPTEHMLDWGQGALDYTPINRCETQATKVWRSMINAALKE